MERILPARKDRPLTFPLPQITSMREAADINVAVIDAVSNLAINLGEAAEIAKLIDALSEGLQDRRVR
jgi:hypothetical protein